MAFKALRGVFVAESTTTVPPDPLERIEPFEYAAIPEAGFIRLVQLEAGAPTSPIRCKLVTKPLSKEIKYRALSYVWGDPNDKQSIICNHFRLGITNNLHAALLQLRASSDQGDGSLLWIDAICIDQNNILEKTAQIKMMKDIYSKATLTIIWLGDRFESGGGNPQAIDSYEGIRLLKAIHAATAGLSSQEERINAALQLINPPNASKEEASYNWLKIYSILARPWFTRIWVVQEFIASSSCLVYIGDSIVEPNVIFEVAETLRESNHWGVAMLPYARNHTRSNPVILNASHLYSLSRKCRKEKGMKMSELLREIMTFKTTNPLDGVFALVGLASDVGPQFIDYSLGLRDVHVKVAQQALTSSRTETVSPLDFLLSVRGDSFDDNSFTPRLPSWAPNIRRYDLAEDAAFVPLPSIPLTDREKLPLRLTFGPDESLQLPGQVVGTVQTVISDHPYTLPRTTRMNKSYCMDLQKWEAEVHHLASSLERRDVRVVYARTLAFITDNTADHACEHLKIYEAFHEMLGLLPRTLSPFEDEEMPISEGLLAMNIRIDELSTTCRHFTESFDRYSAGRRFAVIGGSQIGWVPAGTQLGDKICIFRSCSVPFAVRPCGEGYRLLGGCFVDGLTNEMDGNFRENVEDMIIY